MMDWFDWFLKNSDCFFLINKLKSYRFSFCIDVYGNKISKSTDHDNKHTDSIRIKRKKNLFENDSTENSLIMLQIIKNYNVIKI